MTGARDQTDSSTTRPALNVLPAEDGSGSAQGARTASSATGPSKKRRHRGGKKRRNRRQSFAAPPSETSGIASNMDNIIDEEEQDSGPMRPGESFYKRKSNRSTESVDSDALLDHRNHQPMRQRRESRLNVLAAQRAGASARQRSHDSRHHARRRTVSRHSDESDEDDPTDRTPLISESHRSPVIQSGYDNLPYDVNNPPSVPGSPHVGAADDPMMPEPGFLKRSLSSSRNIKNKFAGDALIDIDRQELLDGDPNSAPPSPRLAPEGMTRHKRAMTYGPDADVCFPSEAMSEMAEEDFEQTGSRDETNYSRPRRRKREWPQLWVLDEWSREEKEDRAADQRRMRRINEPVMVEGRLRPSKPKAWHRDEEAAPLRYTYFNEEFESTIHAATISELVPEGGCFRELFIPEPPELDESSSSESDADLSSIPAPLNGAKSSGVTSPKNGEGESGHLQSRLSQVSTLQQRSQSQEPSQLESARHTRQQGKSSSGSRAPSKARSIDHGELAQQNAGSTSAPKKKEKPTKYGPRPTFWLDVMSPTDAEMSVLQKAFGLHPLTKEDILMQEAREKVELFKNYYFINYRTFEQDTESEDYLEPVNVYIVVFRYGILTFHFGQIPHPANVRRRIRQLKDYLILSSDWVGYAMIDDITDAYVPMIHNIEVEVDDIDESVLDYTPGAFAVNKDATGDEKLKKENNEKNGIKDDKSSTFSFSLPFGKGEDKRDTSGYDMLRRVGETRKKVMSLYRLLGTKADVIKGFAKRCNEQWDVAPKSEIGLYLGDIQDHILTMTSNLGHYETLLSRAHSNYLAQVSIRMNERSEQTGDVLSKLTVFGTIVLPMNIICGMWGMNVKVPGQDVDSLWWFWGITGFLFVFALGCYLLCKKLYGIV
ncbi:CorA metal ion transporter [Lithohypha guttulata]|uniref:CorA metal ion transporter n=1 Tax=Lithohypha guttulata TaxID=1690604 RepID=UPI002DE055C3|nr:CorA metal ion transporter [Lithohypha guttulata]